MPTNFDRRNRLTQGLFLALLLMSGGCASLTNPVVDGIPVRRLPEELLGESREELKPIPLTILGQKKPDAHLVDAGDILGIVIEGVLGDKNQPAPVRLGDNMSGPPAQGFPIAVQDDGTILLPYVSPIEVKNKTLAQVQETLRKAYTEDKEILKSGSERIIVTLLQPRKFEILVVREDGGSAGVNAGAVFGGNGTIIGSSKQGKGFKLELSAYENDVLTALAQTGGLPGTDAKNEVIIYRKGNNPLESMEPIVTRIPLRVRPNAGPPFRPEEIILNKGDILYIESREAEVFYTAGLLGSGQFPLPRDYDLDVIQAIALVRGPLINGGFSQNFGGGNTLNSGIGQPSPSLVTVLRKTTTGQQIPIRVDLNLAFKDPRERLRIQPGDFLVLQEKPYEAVVRYSNQMLRFNFFGTVIRRNDLLGTGNLNIP
jgi:protein involved in polysaccharide export with SLBB domain